MCKMDDTKVQKIFDSLKYNNSPTNVEIVSFDNDELVPQEVFTPALQELYGWINVQRSISGMILSHANWPGDSTSSWVYPELLKKMF